MAISIQCESCGASFKVADTFAGKRGKCPKCSHVFRAPGGAAGGGSSVKLKGPTRAVSNSPKSVRPARGSSSDIQTSKDKTAPVKPVSSAKKRSGSSPQPPQAPVRAVPVGSLPEEIPQGRLPGESGMGTAKVRPAGVNVAQGVRPASGPMVSTGKASTTTAYRHKRKKGTPVILWVIIALGGLSAGGGWIYYMLREDPAQPVVAKQSKNDTSKKAEGTEGAKAADKNRTDASTPASDADEDTQPKSEVADEDSGGETSDAAAESSGEASGGGDDDLGLALGGGDLPKGAKRIPRQTVPTSTPEKKEEAKEAEEEKTAPPTEPASAEKIKELAAICEENAWKADSEEQYEALSNLASAMMNYADDAAGDAAIGLLNGPLTEIVWTTEKARRMNRQAMKDLDTIGKGCFVLGEVTEQVEGGAILQLVRTDAWIKIEMSGPQLALIRPGKMFLLIGSVEPEKVDLPPAEDSERARTARVINALFRVGISEVYDREDSTIGPAVPP